MAFGIEKCGRILLETSFSYSMFENDEEERLIVSFLIVQSVKYNQKVIIIFAWFPDTSKRCDEGLLCLSLSLVAQLYLTYRGVDFHRKQLRTWAVGLFLFP